MHHFDNRPPFRTPAIAGRCAASGGHNGNPAHQCPVVVMQTESLRVPDDPEYACLREARMRNPLQLVDASRALGARVTLSRAEFFAGIVVLAPASALRVPTAVAVRKSVDVRLSAPRRPRASQSRRQFFHERPSLCAPQYRELRNRKQRQRSTIRPDE